ncbi:alpha/beta fold hydrolase [Blastococcus sp. SYSU DS0533]
MTADNAQRTEATPDLTDLVARAAEPVSPGRAPTSTWTEVPSLGVSLHARTWREDATPGRPPVVLVHGLGLSSRYLVPLGRRLGALGHDVLAPDLPGFGRSPRPAGTRWPAAPTVREQTDQLRCWMDAMGIERAVLVGNSIGVQVAVELAARHPDRVESLVLEGPTPDPEYRSPWKEYPRVLRNMLFEAPSINPVFQAEYATTGMVRMFQQLFRTVDDPIEQRLPLVQAPALVVRGQYDQTLSQPWAEEFTRLLPNGRLVVVDGAAHNAHYTAAPIVGRLVDRFLRGGLAALTPATGDVVVPGPDHGGDPLTPFQLLSPRAHAVLDYVSAAALVALPRVFDWGPRTRVVLTAAGVYGAACSLVTDYDLGALKKMPVPVHLNLDSSGGMQLVLASLTVLRGEPAVGRWVAAAQGAYEILRAALTHKPMGPARLVPVDRSS